RLLYRVLARVELPVPAHQRAEHLRYQFTHQVFDASLRTHESDLPPAADLASRRPPSIREMSCVRAMLAPWGQEPRLRRRIGGVRAKDGCRAVRRHTGAASILAQPEPTRADSRGVSGAAGAVLIPRPGGATHVRFPA